MADFGQTTLFAIDCGATNWRLYRVEYRHQADAVQIIGNPQPAPLTSFVDRRLPAVITLNPAGNCLEAFGEVAQQQLDDERLRGRIREHFKPCIGSHLETNPLPHQKRYTHTQAMQYTQLLLQAVLEQLKQEKMRSAEFDDRVVFAFAYPVHWRYEYNGQIFNEFKSIVSTSFPEGFQNLRFVAEPEAAILSLNSRGLINRDGDNQATLIVDVGGSTTDIVAGNLDPRTERLEFLGRFGAPFGGDLYDVEIAKYIADELKIPPSALADDPSALISLRLSAQRLKESLSRQLLNTKLVNHNPQRMVTLVLQDGSVYRRVITLDLPCFDKITENLKDQFTKLIDTALKVISLEESRIGQVVLVGGGAQLFTIIAYLRQRFGETKVLLADTPEEIVVQGLGLEYGAAFKKIEPTLQFPVSAADLAALDRPVQSPCDWQLTSSELEPFLLVPGTITVGRGKDSDLLIDDPKVSRCHAEFRVSGVKLELVDLNSTNGTFVNSQRLPAHEPRELQPGDEIRFGNTVYICQR